MQRQRQGSGERVRWLAVELTFVVERIEQSGLKRMRNAEKFITLSSVLLRNAGKTRDETNQSAEVMLTLHEPVEAHDLWLAVADQSRRELHEVLALDGCDRDGQIFARLQLVDGRRGRQHDVDPGLLSQFGRRGLGVGGRTISSNRMYAQRLGLTGNNDERLSWSLSVKSGMSSESDGGALSEPRFSMQDARLCDSMQSRQDRLPVESKSDEVYEGGRAG